MSHKIVEDIQRDKYVCVGGIIFFTSVVVVVSLFHWIYDGLLY